MSYILCATDFKDASNNSAIYAAGLCLRHGLKLILLHVKLKSGMFGNHFSKSINTIHDELDAVINKVNLYYPDVKIEGEVVEGEVIDGLNRFISLHGEPLVTVVGNQYHAEHSAFFEVNLMEIFRHLKSPVLAIPTGCVFSVPTKLCFAYDNHFHGSEDALLRIKNLVAVLQMELHFVIGSSDAFSRDNPPDINSHAGRILDTTVVHPHFLTPHNLDHSIVSFAEKNDMDWLAVMPRKHSFIENLLHKSHAQFMVNHAHIPVLAFHEVL